MQLKILVTKFDQTKKPSYFGRLLVDFGSVTYEL